MFYCQYCDKECKNKNSLVSHERMCSKNPNKVESLFKNLNTTMSHQCMYCNKSLTVGNIKRHEDSCYMNPKNLKNCVVCNNPIKDYKNSKGTCSHSCSNKHFRDLRNMPDKYTKYRTICWKHHKKECIVCGENKIVAVHHYNEDHADNSIANLIPLCPTHHQYMHSKHKKDILHIVEKYNRRYERLQI